MSTVNQFFIQLAFFLLGQRAAYRFGRALYQKARGEIANGMPCNGEIFVQRCVVAAWIRDATQDRLTVFDVGANVGEWSAGLLNQLIDCNIGESADLYAFEPVPTTFNSLKRRLAHQYPHVHLEQVALSSQEGETTMHVPYPGAGTSSLYPCLDDSESIVKIQTVTATSFCRKAKIPQIQLMKCDTEGHDMEVIRGASSLLAEGRIAVLQFEYNHRWIYARNFLRDVFTMIEKLPYHLAKLQADSLLMFAEWHPEIEKYFEGNYALVRTDALGWFPTKEVSFDRFNSMVTHRK